MSEPRYNATKILSGVSGIAEDEIRSMMAEMAALRAGIDAEWAAGKRDGLRLQAFALAGYAHDMADAILRSDATAYQAAAKRAREHAATANIHASQWVKRGGPA